MYVHVQNFFHTISFSLLCKYTCSHGDDYFTCFTPLACLSINVQSCTNVCTNTEFIAQYLYFFHIITFPLLCKCTFTVAMAMTMEKAAPRR